MYIHTDTSAHTHTGHIKKYPNTYQGNHGCYEKCNTFPFTQPGTTGSTRILHISLLKSMHWRQEAAPLGRLRGAGGRAKGERLGWKAGARIPRPKSNISPSLISLKMRQRKYWRSADNEQLRHDSVSPSQQGTKDEKARLAGISNLFKFEISAKSSPVLDRCSPKKERGGREPRGKQGKRLKEEARKVLTRKGYGGDIETTLYPHRSYQGYRFPKSMSKGVGQSVSRDSDGDRTHNHKTTHDYRTLQ